jgi:cytosine/adenosine deaminase-related metal-dependent hydrolase
MSVFYRKLRSAIREQGGMFNAHLHMDRAGTLDERYLAHVDFRILDASYKSLHEKHGVINEIHAGHAYERDDLARRVNAVLDEMVAANTVRADTMVDCTADRVGLTALETLSAIRDARAHEIRFMLGAYSPFGFIDREPERWEVMVEGARRADFIGCLPEADDLADYPGHIGFGEHLKRMLVLARDEGKMLHVHTDQRNEPSEDGTEQLIDAVRRHGAPVDASGEPMVWAVHMISPSTYDDARFDRLVDGLLECNIGVISCPSAAIGMRQLRPLATPTYNSIPRLLELIAAGVHVRLGSDNIDDILSPSTTADLVDEVYMLSAALRFYHPGILARLAAGRKLDDADRAFVREHLAANAAEIGKILGHAR